MAGHQNVCLAAAPTLVRCPEPASHPETRPYQPLQDRQLLAEHGSSSTQQRTKQNRGGFFGVRPTTIRQDPSPRSKAGPLITDVPSGALRIFRICCRWTQPNPSMKPRAQAPPDIKATKRASSITRRVFCLLAAFIPVFPFGIAEWFSGKEQRKLNNIREY